MTENSQSPVQSMLLAAPKEVRLDLAIASLLYSVRRELVEVAVGSQRRIAPVYYFFDAQRNYPTFFFSPNHLNLPPWQPGKPPPDPVPSYASDTQSSWAVRDFVQCVTLTYYQKVLSVVVTNGTQVWEERATITSHMYRERETCRLIALATLHVYAPDLLPVLDAEQQEEQMKEVLAGAPRTTHQIQEIVLAPALLPLGLLESRRCQYQEYDIRHDTWHSCRQEWQNDAEACYPEQCPTCGAYYCEQHFSDVAYLFEATEEERRVSGTPSVTLNVCQVCALFPEESVRRLRQARLAINGVQK